MIDNISGSSEPDTTQKNPEKPTPTVGHAHPGAPVDGGAPFDMNLDDSKDGGKKAKKKRRSIKEWFLSLPKKKRIMVIAAAVLVLGSIIAVLLYVFVFAKTPNSDTPVIEPAMLDNGLVPSRLTGVEVPKSLSKRPVTGVMIENSTDARPQSGLRNAGVVFEAVAEAGITRFLALYQEDQPNRIGPIRSARPYYLDWVLPFKAAYAHVGGSPEALAEIKQLGVRDLDQFFNSEYYERISERSAPHNMYSSMNQLDKAKKARGFKKSKFNGFARTEEENKAKKKQRINNINLEISSSTYNVRYKYAPESNSYKRFMGGEPHTDEKTGKQIRPKVVIALVMSKGTLSDGYHTKYGTVGKGKAFFFQDGKKITGTWKKKNRTSEFKFTRSSGNKMKLNAGQTWITIVDSPEAVKAGR